MKKKDNGSNPNNISASGHGTEKLQGHALYPDNGDISRIKILSDEHISTYNEKKIEEVFSGSNLDVPGSELYNDMENSESDDEENYYLSLGRG